MVYKTVQVTWYCSSMIVVALGLQCLYFASYVGVRHSRVALLLPLALLDDFTASKCRLHTLITYTLTTCDAIVRGEA
jgi:hypothetical protein